MKTVFIIWNQDRTEGFLTFDQEDAKAVSTGKSTCGTFPSAGLKFRETYLDEDDSHTVLPIQSLVMSGW